MNIIYVSSGCSEKQFQSLVENGLNHDLPQAQKYHRLLMEGLGALEGIDIIAVTARPVDSKLTRKRWFQSEKETANKIAYYYLPLINIKVIRQILLYYSAKKKINKEILGKKTIVVCDIWNQSIAEAAKRVCHKRKIPIVGIVTDVPGHRSSAYVKKSIIGKLISKMTDTRLLSSANNYDGYLLLAEAMNTVVNKKNRPYIVLEGHADRKMLEHKNILENKSRPKVLLYAGTLHKQYGIKMLVEAFDQLQNEEWELHIYGKGDYVDDLKKIIANNDSIKFWGERDNQYIVSKEIEATLLVNPRPTDSDFVKYSFPSKIMEYMSSGTVLVTTNLPSMPEEYKKYVYVFEEETVNGFKRKLEELFALSKEELYIRGMMAKKFVLENKNNIVQAREFVNMLKQL